MRWSKPKQGMLAKLQAIEHARKTAAEARLGSARAEADEAVECATSARSELQQAEHGWTDHLSTGRFSIELQLAFAEDVLRKERELGTCEKQQREADQKFEHEKHGWQELESGVRAGERVLRKGRRFLARRADDAHDHALGDQTTWRWFRR